jgi:glycosyltransferase involved in cell wall biosynthesis
VVARLLRYKRIGIAVRAATLASLPLDVIGDGPDRRRLETLAGPSVRFLGRRSDDEVRDAMATCTALLVPGVEDFGLTIVEVQASGRPPVATAAGGALESIRDGTTGYLVRDATPAGFVAGMERAMRDQLAPDALIAAARDYDVPVFRARLDALLTTTLEQRRSSPARALVGARA